MASVASAIRTKITAANVTNVTTKVYRDVAPDDTAMPFVTFMSDLSRSPELEGDGIVMARRQMLRVDLWQKLKDENVAIVEQVLAAVDGADLTGVDKKVFNCRVTDIQRLVDLDDGICHHALTLEVVHT